MEGDCIRMTPSALFDWLCLHGRCKLARERAGQGTECAASARQRVGLQGRRKGKGTDQSDTGGCKGERASGVVAKCWREPSRWKRMLPGDAHINDAAAGGTVR